MIVKKHELYFTLNTSGGVHKLNNTEVSPRKEECTNEATTNDPPEEIL